MDVLWVSSIGSETVIRTRQADAVKIMAAAAACTASPRMAVIKHSGFLPSLLSAGKFLP